MSNSVKCQNQCLMGFVDAHFTDAFFAHTEMECGVIRTMKKLRQLPKYNLLNKLLKEFL